MISIVMLTLLNPNSKTRANVPEFGPDLGHNWAVRVKMVKDGVLTDKIYADLDCYLNDVLSKLWNEIEYDEQRCLMTFLHPVYDAEYNEKREPVFRRIEEDT